MSRDIRVYIDDILDSIEKIEQYTQAVSELQFLADTQLQDAVLRRLEIMGEAVKNIPQAFRDKWPQIPWKKVAGLRDVLIHEYFGVNMHRTWKVVQQDIYDLREQLVRAQRDLGHTD